MGVESYTCDFLGEVLLLSSYVTLSLKNSLILNGNKTAFGKVCHILLFSSHKIIKKVPCQETIFIFSERSNFRIATPSPFFDQKGIQFPVATICPSFCRHHSKLQRFSHQSLAKATPSGKVLIGYFSNFNKSQLTIHTLIYQVVIFILKNTCI